jgi:YegS/Rv2252/BmrU family lipid kinase
VSRRFALFVNPAASGGRATQAVAPACAELDRRGAPFRVVAASGLGEALREARSAAEAGETVVAVGGDGLVGPLGGALRGAPEALAIIPAGRGNDFARVVGIPRDPAAAARLAIEGPERLVDVAEANGRPFVGIASLGFDSDANRVANEARLIRGKLVYVYAALRALIAWRPATFEVTVDGQTETVTGYSVAVANSKAYGGGMYVAPHAELDDGRLEVMTIARRSKLRFLVGLPKVFKGTHVNEPGIRFRSGARVEIGADRPFAVYADGDPIADLPMTVTVSPRSLRLVAPPVAAAPAS